MEADRGAQDMNRMMMFVAGSIAVAFAGQALAGDISPEANRELVVAHAKLPGVMVLPSGLQYRIIKSGMGEMPAANDTVTVSYKGTRVDGYVFDSTKPGETRNLPLSKVIPGWIEALSMMKVGDEWELLVPAKLAYGEERSGADLWGQALLFDVQLVGVVHSSP
jgi:FKBP-type peptidyl-prolyl cis-trans isomerase